MDITIDKYSEARQKLAFLLNQAANTGKVLIRKKRQNFFIISETNPFFPFGYF
jgi:PHD/YefM family antitoxin component YafN of YafNO toxin-antitoxin module